MADVTLRLALRSGSRNVSNYPWETTATRKVLALAIFASVLCSAACGGGGSGGLVSGTPPLNLAPAIVSLSPDTMNAGGPAFTVTITGYNFVSSSTVQWNGSSRTTTYISSTQLQAQITTGDITSAGSASLSVTNPAPGGGSSGSAEFTVKPTSNPAPTVLSLNPSSVNAGSSQFILTVSGSNFIPNSVIEWNGEGLSTNYLSDTQLEAQIPASDLADPEVAVVVVLNPVPGGGTSAPLAFAVNYEPVIVSQLANDLVWDATHQVIYLSVPSLASSNGNTVVALNPIDGAITAMQFAGSEPDVLAISSDDQFLYSALDGSSSVQRFTLPNLLPDTNYSLGADPFFGPYFGVDLQVAPGLPRTTAVSRGNFIVSPVALGGMAIYDDSAQRPTLADAPGRLYDSMEWGSDTAIYAINSEIASFDFYVLGVNSSGVALSEDYQTEFSTFYVRMHYDTDTGFVYTDDGYVINPANGQHIGAFQASGYMVPDSTLNRAFFFGQTQSQAGTNNFTIESFDLTTFAPIAELPIPNVRGNPLRFIRWGTSGLAFNDDAGFTYIINNNSLVAGIASQKQTKISNRALSPVQRDWLAPKPRLQDKINSRIRPSNSQIIRRQPLSPEDFNPSPGITSLSPSAVTAGQVGLSGFTLTVVGTNFVSLSTVEWNGSARQTEFVSNTELQAHINFADVLNAGSASVDVVTPGPGGGTSNALTCTALSQTNTPAPFIVSLSPNSVSAGSSGFTLDVHANWATNSSIVEWNGSPRPTTNIGDLQAQISAADVASVGYAQVTVITPGLGGGISNTAEFQILYQPMSVNQSTNDMVWDPLNHVFYISVPSTASSYPNQVCALNPASGAITNCQSGSEPDVLAISDDSKFLYVGMDGTSSVQRFILPGLIPDINYLLGTEQGTGEPYFALDLQVAPGAPHTTALTRGTATDPKATGGITIYDDSTPRPISALGWGPTGNLYDSLQWGANATELYAASTEGNADFYTLDVNSSGVVLEQDYPGVFWNPYGIHYDSANGLIYSDDGFHVISPSTGLPVGIFEGGGPMAPDSTLNTVFILTQYVWQGNSNYTIDLFDMTHYVRVGSVPFSTTAQLRYPIGRFIRWGANGLAVNFKGDKVYLLSGSFVTGTSAHAPQEHSGRLR